MRNINIIVLSALVVSIVAAGAYSLGMQRSEERGARSEHNGKPQTANKVVLYYRNPMGLADTSPVPKKDSMGMDYIAVYEGEVTADGTLGISAEKVQKLGVRSEAAALRSLDKTIQSAGRIEIDERLSYTIAPKFEGWVERLYVNSTGATVSKGQALFDVYSPELVSVQREYAIAVQGESTLVDAEAKAGMKQLAEGSLARLKNWDISPSEIKQLTSGKTRRRLSYYAPVAGVVLEKKALQGMRFMPGETLYQIADLSSVWVVADIAEQDVGQIALGSKVQIAIAAYPGKVFEGKVSFISPVLNPATRTIAVRVEVANPKGLLKPAMYASMTLSLGGAAKVLSVPSSAVIDSGTRQIVLIRRDAGRFEPRAVKVGRRDADYIEVIEGLSEGEQVVTSALFLIDAESNLKAALSGMGGAPVQTPPVNKSVGHQGQGVLNSVNSDGSVNITHEPIKTLNWPAMSMDFELTNSSLATGIKPGAPVSFELVERAPDEWVITSMKVRSREGR